MNLRPGKINTTFPDEACDSSMGSCISVALYRSIHEIDRDLWDSINAPKDLFHTHRFISAVEDSQVEESAFWYLLMYSGGKLEATAVLTSFRVKLDLFLAPFVRCVFMAIRRVFPAFMAPRVLFCGLPISLGKNALAIANIASTSRVLSCLATQMLRLARSERIPLVAIKEFTQAELGEMEALRGLSFLLEPSIPYARLSIRWKTFEEYLHAMRHTYRRHILLSLKKLGLRAPVIHRNGEAGKTTEIPRLVLCDEKSCPPELFFRLYAEVMERSRVKLEVLNEEFFRRLYATLNGDLEILALVQGTTLLGAALLTSSTAGMTFMLVGLDYAARDRFDVYFNLVYGLVALAIERECEYLDLGQTSYWLKGQIGAECTEEYFYLHGTRRIVHRLLDLCGPLLFPKTRLQAPHVFRSPIQDNPRKHDFRYPGTRGYVSS